MPKCQFSAAGVGVAAAAGERPISTRKTIAKNARGRRDWLVNRKDKRKSKKEKDKKKKKAKRI